MTNDINTILVDSAVLLLVGMSVVFIFLSILIFAIHAIEWITKRFPDEEDTQPHQFAAPVVAPQVVPPGDAQVDTKVVAAISAAVHQYRNSQQ